MTEHIPEHIWTSQNSNLYTDIAPYSAQNSYWWQEESYQQQIADTLSQENDIEKTNSDNTTNKKLDETD